jgi:hypothetical protein
MIQSVEDCWKALGLNLTEMASKVADEVVDSWQDDMKKK